MRHIRFAFLNIPLKRNKCPISCGIEASSIGCIPKTLPNEEMSRGLNYAYSRLMRDFHCPTTNITSLPYLTPILAHVLDQFHSKKQIKRPAPRVLEIGILSDAIQHEFTEDPAKYFGGIYSLSEACTLIVAGMCGPESPLWESKPRRQEMTVAYKGVGRTDLLEFHRDYETDGDWLIANINKIL